MACCGQGRSASPNATAPAASTDSARTPVVFEHRGSAALTLYGRVTGIRYHFTGPGARVPVDGRDAGMLDLVREVERVGA